ncbi:MAG: gliding motility-associated C-terminal domain-containing protein [Breznakibacter sp.]
MDEVSGLSEGGYEVTITDGSSTNVYRCWAFVPEITGSPTIEVESHTCSLIDLECSGVSTKALSCVNPQNGVVVPISYGLEFQWFADGTQTGTSGTAQQELDAPYSDTDYSVSVTSRFSFLDKLTSSVNVVAKAVNAAFEYKIIKNEVDNEYNTESEGSAPLRVEFYGEPDGTDNRSKGHITAYTWAFGDTGKDFIPNPSFVFLTAGTYAVTLTVENQASGCTSTSEAESFEIIDLFLDVPNFFTPTGDGIHDEFRVAYSSVKEFKMVIVNRWGRVVYESTNPDKGWDGNVNGKHAAPGVYFYDVVAKGYNKGEQKHMKGFLHLLRREK